MKRLLIALATLIISTNQFAQTIDNKKLDSLFNILAAKNLAMGSITIMQNGQLVYQRSIGKNQTEATTYRIGSISKLFTAALIYELVDAKKLSFEDTLSEFFPNLPNAGKITIVDMLGHRSGLANFTAMSTNFDTWKYQPQTHEQLLDFIRNQKPDFAPGTKADYNNSNYLLLGYIVETIYQKSYKDIVQEKIIQKLNLPNTYYGNHEGFRNKETPYYKYFDKQWQTEKAVYLDNFAGAGAMISTPTDMCQLIKAIFDGKIVSKASLARMTHIEKDGYGWGMFPFGDSLHKGYGHNGKTEGFASSLQYYPEKKLAIAYCTSGEVYPKDNILNYVFKICFSEHCTIPTFTPITLTEQQLQPFTGAYAGDNDLRVSGSIINGGLVLETKGQQIAVEALSDLEFYNARFGFFFEFDKEGKQLIVYDASATYMLRKK